MQNLPKRHLSILCGSLETGPPPYGQLNAGVRKEEGLARRPCRARTQECCHLQFEAMHVHTLSCEYGYLLQNMRALHFLCKVQREVGYPAA